MSRSYKKHPGWVLKGRYGRYQQKLAAKRFRRMKGQIPNGNWYRKCHPQWDIIDYKSIYHSREDARRCLKGVYEDDELHIAWCK